MKPLAHWAIHHQQKIRIIGRDRMHIWGILTAPDGKERPFRYNQVVKFLIVGAKNDQQGIQLDDYGMVVEEAKSEE